MAVLRWPRFLRQSYPGVPSDVMVCLRVLTRTGRVDFRRPYACFTPSSGSTAMSILCVAHWRSARSMIEWMCTQERWNPEVAIIFAAARCRWATAGSSHDDANPDNSTLHTGAVRPHTGFVGSLFFISPRFVDERCQLFRAFRGRALFVRGMMHPYFSMGPPRQRLPRRAGSFGISWRIHSLVKKTLHRHRAGFEPQRASSFMKRVKASQILGEAVRA